MTDKELIILSLPKTEQPTARFRAVLEAASNGVPFRILTLTDPTALSLLRGRRVLFAVELGVDGINLSYYTLLQQLRADPHALEGSLGAVLVDGDSDLYTKSIGRELVFTANMAGCAFLGRPLVEGTRTLSNFDVQADYQHCDRTTAYHLAARELVERLLTDRPAPTAAPKIAVLHASNRSTSNTLALWQMVRDALPGCTFTEINLRNGAVEDCAGCPYATCLHFGEKGECFYGGAMVEEVYPAVLEADAVVMLCPNYNDALSASLTAFINRLTAIFRVRRFYDKRLYALVVSGYSGGELLSQQLISAMNMNKSFYLPPRFALLVTANTAGAVEKLPHIREDSAAFAAKMLQELFLP